MSNAARKIPVGEHESEPEIPKKSMWQLPRPLWVVLITTFLNQSGAMSILYLGIYLTGLGYSETDAGRIVAVIGLTGVLTGGIAGRICDRFGAKLVIVLSLILSGSCLLLFPFARGLFAIGAMTFLFALANSPFRPAAFVLVNAWSPAGQTKTGFAAFQLALNLGMVIAPILGGALSQVSFTALFAINGVMSLISACVMFVFFRKSGNIGAGVQPQERRDEVKSTSAPHPLKSVKFLFYLLAAMPPLTIYYQHVFSLPMYLVRELKFNPTRMGSLLAINAVLVILLAIPLARVLERKPARSSLLVGTALLALGFGAMAFTESYFGLALTVIIWSFGEIIFLPSAAAGAAAMSSPERRGEYMGYFLSTHRLSFMFASIYGSELLQRFGGRTLWIATFCLGMVSVVLFARIQLPAENAKVQK